MVYLNTRTTTCTYTRAITKMIGYPLDTLIPGHIPGQLDTGMEGISLQHGTPSPKPGLKPTDWKSTALPAEPFFLTDCLLLRSFLHPTWVKVTA